MREKAERMAVEPSPRFWRDLRASLGAAVISETIVLPIDTVKVAVQTAPAHLRPNTWQTASILWERGGWRSFYRAWTPAVARQMAFTSIRFGSYAHLDPWIKQGNSKFWVPLAVGASVGALANGVALPADVLKRQLQATRYVGSAENLVPLGVWQQGQQVWREEGWRGFYRGWWQTTQRSVLISAIQLPVYFGLSTELRRREWPLLWRNTVAAAATTLAVTTVVYPIDLCTSLVMTWRKEYEARKVYSTTGIFRQWTEKAGGPIPLGGGSSAGRWRSLYRGYPLALGKALPQFWLLSFCFEWLRG